MHPLVALVAALVAAAHHPPPAHPRAGTALGTLRIPRIGLVAAVDQGDRSIYSAVWPATLDHGPAHLPGTALPWQRGAAVLSGHRTTHTRPFWRINELRYGDLIVWRTAWGTFRYRVYDMRVVGPGALWVLHAGPHRLVLTACHPPLRATRRIVVFARLWRVTS